VHSYPSHGYLLHRIAMSMAFNNIWGLFEACGPLGNTIAKAGRTLSTTSSKIRSAFLFQRRRKQLRNLRKWQATGASRALYVCGNNNVGEGMRPLGSGNVRIMSFLDMYLNSATNSSAFPDNAKQYQSWVESMP
jgi:hypothetical protein